MKHELMQLRQERALAVRGYELLELQRQALTLALREKKAGAARARAAAAARVDEAYLALENAYVDLGEAEVEQVRQRINHTGAYTLAGTTAATDDAFFAWAAAKEALVAMLDAENALLAHLQSIRKISKRASALKHMRIPQCEARIRYIEGKLEERERDALARLKLIKSRAT